MHICKRQYPTGDECVYGWRRRRFQLQTLATEVITFVCLS